MQQCSEGHICLNLHTCDQIPTESIQTWKPINPHKLLTSTSFLRSLFPARAAYSIKVTLCCSLLYYFRGLTFHLYHARLWLLAGLESRWGLQNSVSYLSVFLGLKSRKMRGLCVDLSIGCACLWYPRLFLTSPTGFNLLAWLLLKQNLSGRDFVKHLMSLRSRK